MKLTEFSLLFLTSISLTSSFSLRSSRYSKNTISRREAEPETNVLSAPLTERFDENLLSYLEKRRGGGGSSGGGGGRGGSSSGSSSSGSSSSSSGSSSSAGKSGSTTGASGNTGTASSSSSASRGYGGGAYYGGGSASAYRSGTRSPGGIAPYLLAGAALGFFPGLWLYGAYTYPYSHPYTFRNDTSNQNETLPIKCLCAEYSACGCDDNNNSTFLNALIGNGSVGGENAT
ncbi:hypothetical protein P7C71_g540, partial [Lecanoromycetidae sp. Uapishka_2]